MRGRRSEVFQFNREIRNHGMDLFRSFRRQPFSPAARELVAAGDDLTGSVFEQTVSDVIRTADEPSVDVAVFSTRRTDCGVNHIRCDAVRQDGSVRAIKLFLQIVVNFGMFSGEADGLSVTGAFPTFVLNRMTFTALFRTDEFIREVQNASLAEAILGRHGAVARLMR